MKTIVLTIKDKLSCHKSSVWLIYNVYIYSNVIQNSIGIIIMYPTYCKG